MLIERSEAPTNDWDEGEEQVVRDDLTIDMKACEGRFVKPARLRCRKKEPTEAESRSIASNCAPSKGEKLRLPQS